MSVERKPVVGHILRNPILGTRGKITDLGLNEGPVTAQKILTMLDSDELYQTNKPYIYSTKEANQSAVMCALCKCEETGLVFVKINKGGNNFFTHPPDSRKNCQKHDCLCNSAKSMKPSYRIRTNPSISTEGDDDGAILVIKLNIEIPDDAPVDELEISDKIESEWGLKGKKEINSGFVTLSIKVNSALPKINFSIVDSLGVEYIVRIDGFDFDGNTGRNRLWGRKTDSPHYSPINISRRGNSFKISESINNYEKLLFVSGEKCGIDGKHQYTKYGNTHWKRKNDCINQVCIDGHENICYITKSGDWKEDGQEERLYNIICKELDLNEIIMTSSNNKISLLVKDDGKLLLFLNSPEEKVDVKITISKIGGYMDRESDSLFQEVIEDESNNNDSNSFSDIMMSEGLKDISKTLSKRRAFGLKVKGNVIIEIFDKKSQALLFRDSVKTQKQVEMPTLALMTQQETNEMMEKYKTTILSKQGWNLEAGPDIQSILFDILRQAIMKSISNNEFTQSGVTRKLNKISNQIGESLVPDANNLNPFGSVIESLMEFQKTEVGIQDPDVEINNTKNWGWGVLTPKILLPENTEYGIIFDHRPSQLLFSQEDIDKDSIVHLSSGFRLIKRGIALRLIDNKTHKKIINLPSLSIIHDTPHDFLYELIQSKWDSDGEFDNMTEEEWDERSLYFHDIDNDGELDPKISRSGMDMMKFSKSWDDFRTNRLILDDRIFSVSRFVLENSLEESIQHIFWLRETDSKGDTIKRIILFDSSFAGRVPSAWNDYVNESASLEKRKRSYVPLKETIRAIYSLSVIKETNSYPQYSKAPYWVRDLAPWSIRIFLDDKKPTLHQLSEIDLELATYVDSATAKRLWLK